MQSGLQKNMTIENNPIFVVLISRASELASMTNGNSLCNEFEACIDPKVTSAIVTMRLQNDPRFRCQSTNGSSCDIDFVQNKCET